MEATGKLYNHLRFLAPDTRLPATVPRLSSYKLREDHLNHSAACCCIQTAWLAVAQERRPRCFETRDSPKQIVALFSIGEMMAEVTALVGREPVLHIQVASYLRHCWVLINHTAFTR